MSSVSQFRELIIGGILVLCCAIMGIMAASYPLMTLFVCGSLVAAYLMTVSPLTIFSAMLILAPLRTLIATEAPIRLPLDIGQVLFVLLILIWWLHRAIRHASRLRIPTSLILISIIAFTVVSGFSVFGALSMRAWLTEWLKWLTMLVVIVFVVDLGKDRGWEMIAISLVAAGIANAVIGIYIFFGGSGADHLLINGRYFRAFGTFGQPNPFGGFLGLILPIAIMMCYATIHRLYWHWRAARRMQSALFIQLAYYASGAILMLAGLITSWSRGAWLGLVLALGVMAFCLPRRLWQSIALSGAGLLLLAGLWLGGMIPQSIQARILSSTEDLFSFTDVRGVDITHSNYAIVERLAHWQAAMNMSHDHLWWGVGFGNYEVAYADYRLSNWAFPLGHAHNYYLNILAETGIIGFLFYGGMWFTIIRVTWRIRSHPDTMVSALSVGLMGSWAYFGFHSLLDNLYVNNLFLHLGVLLGLAILFDQQQQTYLQWGDYVPNRSY